MIRHRLKHWRDDSGVMLVVALLVITTVALVTGVMLSHGWTNFKATVGLRGVAGTSYAADAAAKAAINTLRLGSKATVPGATYPYTDWVYSNNIDGTGCFGLDGPNAKDSLLLPGIYPAAGKQTSASSARVDCKVVPGTGLFGSGGGVETNPTNGFVRAITTFGGDLELTDNSLVQIRGGVASNGRIDADFASGTGLFTNGYAWANQGCLGTVRSTPAPDCSHATVSDPSVPDVFTSTSGLVIRDAASQPCNAFKPGYYSNAAALTAKVNTCGTAIFEPGDYYFGFQDEVNGGSNVWTINGTVIGGEEMGSGQPPGRCRSPIDDPTADGVRFVFGGNSRISIGQDAHVELCGTYSEGAPPVVLQQQMTTFGTASTSGQTLTAGNVTTTGSDGTWVPTAASNLLDEALAAADVTRATWSAPGNNKQAIVKLANFSPAASVPAGAATSEALVRVRHAETAATSLTVTVENGTGPTLVTKNYTVAARGILGWDDINVTADFAAAINSGTFAPTITVATAKAKDPTATFDAVQLKLTYTSLTLTAAVNNDFIGGFGNSFKGDFVLQGAVYAPRGRVDVNFGNNADTVVAFRYGMAVREAHLAGHPQVLYGYPLVSIPDQGTGLGKRVTVVDLTVFVCVESPTTCASDKPSLIVRVMITDPPWAFGSKPEPGKRQIKVLSWAEQN